MFLNIKMLHILVLYRSEMGFAYNTYILYWSEPQQINRFKTKKETIYGDKEIDTRLG